MSEYPTQPMESIANKVDGTVVMVCIAVLIACLVLNGLLNLWDRKRWYKD